jgi:hypothetical protein
MPFIQVGVFQNMPLVVIVVVVAVAIVIALLYRFGYLRGGARGKRGEGNEGGEGLEYVQPAPNELQRNQQGVQRGPGVGEVRVGQGGRALLVETRPVEVRPLQSPERSVDVDRIERLIRGIEGELVRVIKQSSADTADLLLSKIGELREYINQLIRQCSTQYPPFSQVGYVPSSISEFRELFRASFVGLLKSGEVVEYTGEQVVSDELVRSLLSYNTDFVVMYYNDKYLYLTRYNDYSLMLITEDYLDPVSGGLVKILFRRFIDEAVKQQS